MKIPTTREMDTKWSRSNFLTVLFPSRVAFEVGGALRFRLEAFIMLDVGGALRFRSEAFKMLEVRGTLRFRLEASKFI